MDACVCAVEAWDQPGTGGGEPATLVQGDARDRHASRRISARDRGNATTLSGGEPDADSGGAGAFGLANAPGEASDGAAIGDRIDPATGLSECGELVSGARVCAAAGDGAAYGDWRVAWADCA